MPSNRFKVSLSSHSIRLRERRGTDPVRFGAFDGHRDFIEEAYEFLSALKDTHTNDLISRSVLKTQLLERDDDSVWGIIQAGPYGHGGEIVDTATFDTSHPLSPREAVVQPFYFFLNAPNDARTGILILHRSGGKGIQTQFVSYLRQFFLVRNKDHIVDVDNLVPAAVLRYLFEGEIRRINIRSYKLPTDLATKVQLGANVAEYATFNQLIQAKLGGFIPRPGFMQPAVLREIISGKRRLAEVIDESEGMVDEMKITFQFNGQQRTVDLARPERILPYIDVSDQVETGDDGHPEIGSLHLAARRLLQDLVHEMGRADANED